MEGTEGWQENGWSGRKGGIFSMRAQEVMNGHLDGKDGLHPLLLHSEETLPETKATLTGHNRTNEMRCALLPRET